MSAPAWTPGPWPVALSGDGKRYIIGDGLVEGPNGYEIAEVYSDDCDPDEASANAHLIAAAPELYEALEYVLTAHGEQLTDALARAQNALAKAHGEAA